MSIHYAVGDLLESDCDYICHQVNCQGKMNSGIAKSIREKWIEVYHSYMERFRVENSSAFLGTIQDIQTFDGPHVINMFSQEYYGYDGRRYTSYDAFWNCLNLIKNTVPKGSKIGFPGYIGSVRGGANWDVIYEMINQVLAEDYEVYIYFLEATHE